MKIVINCDFGGFGLSETAFEMLLNQKGIEWEKVNTGKVFGFDSISYFHKGHAGDDKYYISDSDYYGDRTDKDLVEIVENLKDDANGNYSCLKVVEIPDDVNWYIAEYDGREHVAERHRTWS